MRKFEPLCACTNFFFCARVLAWRQVERFLLADFCTGVFHLLSMSQKKNFSLKRKSLATDLGLRSAKSLLSYPGKIWSPRLPGPRPRMWKKEESYALGKKRTQKRLNCNRSAKLRREKTGRWSSQHAEEMNTEKILESEQSNVFACFWIGKQTFSRAPLKKWQRLSNFWQILTSLEKFKGPDTRCNIARNG